MVLINITKDERKRFIKLQETGLLPSEALKKLETERRLGIVPELEGISKYTGSEKTGLYIGLGVIGLMMIYIYSKSPAPTSALSLHNIKGLDIEALNICIGKGLI